MKDDVVLGKLIDDTAGRDCVHVALLPVKADGILYPGEHVGLVEGSKDTVSVSSPVGLNSKDKIGIVDPFIVGPIEDGTWFYLVLYPQSITGLRHVWTHPRLDAEYEVEYEVKNDFDKDIESKEYLERFAVQAGMTYDVMMERMQAYVAYGQVWTEYDSEYARDAWYNVDTDEFWRHYEVVTGVKHVEGDKHRGVPFRCAC